MNFASQHALLKFDGMSGHSIDAREGHVDAVSDVAWFCVRSQPKHEKVAAMHLRQIDIEVLNPRMRYCRRTKNGPVWVVESMFPNYIFARFNWQTSLNAVHYTRGVAGIVHFGCRWPTLPESVIDGIRALLGPDELHVQENSFSPGDHVEFSDGPMRGLEVVVTQVMPGQQRVAVLMDFLGRQNTVEVPTHAVTKRLYR